MPRLAFALQFDLISVGRRSTYPQPSMREAQPGSGSTWNYLPGRCLQERHTGSSQHCFPFPQHHTILLEIWGTGQDVVASC